MEAAVFLDRDGVINLDHGYVGERARFDFIPGVFSFVRQARSLGYRVVVVTNQSGIARSYFSLDAFCDLTRWMAGCFEAEGAALDAVFFCACRPEHGTPPCEGRKPAPGLFEAARREFDLDPAACVAIGDRRRDGEAAAAAGINDFFLFRASQEEQAAASHNWRIVDDWSDICLRPQGPPQSPARLLVRSCQGMEY